ncbi:MAG TPA: hypothetical protein DIT03_18365, partial [Candidatus Accumulibacter sp.]|nr:hypothetical protein [Accumulibacter sp.]HCN70158.1 hypothetical protein [Accumulibacter sp.]HCV13286.1 hypothetical protein [Accumulibacter sp.]
SFSSAGDLLAGAACAANQPLPRGLAAGEPILFLASVRGQIAAAAGAGSRERLYRRRRHPSPDEAVPWLCSRSATSPAASATSRQWTTLRCLLVAHISFSIGFVAITIRARLAGMDESIFQAARDLWASPWQTFRRVTLPLILPGRGLCRLRYAVPDIPVRGCRFSRRRSRCARSSTVASARRCTR